MSVCIRVYTGHTPSIINYCFSLKKIAQLSLVETGMSNSKNQSWQPYNYCTVQLCFLLNELCSLFDYEVKSSPFLQDDQTDQSTNLILEESYKKRGEFEFSSGILEDNDESEMLDNTEDFDLCSVNYEVDNHSLDNNRKSDVEWDEDYIYGNFRPSEPPSGSRMMKLFRNGSLK
eukprot:GHVL01027827.1.p1 GENE.GHVL01027827.1~~GHVL01027827.1.p1  ORF type:complete len:174 (-),score=16.87 GHVL01027827.1:109-630(-)